MHKMIIGILTIAAYLVLLCIGKTVAAGVFPEGLPRWICYAGAVCSLFGVGFFDGAFRP